ncbi:MAG TPA: NFACT RNA binding domain-containing protein [Sandaracinaceae bacterium]
MSEVEIAALTGLRVQRVDGPRPSLYALTLHGPALHACLLLHAVPGRARWGLVPERPRGAPASAFVRLLRKHLENGRVARAAVSDAGVDIAVRRAEDEAHLRLDAATGRLLLETGGRSIAAPMEADRPRGPRATPGLARDVSALEAAGAAIVEEAVSGASEARARELERAIARRRAKLVRRLRAIEADVERASEVESLRRRASLILAHLRSIPSDAAEVELTDWHLDPPAPVRIPIDPRRGPKGEAEALFRRARKLERAAEIALTRHAETERELEALAAIARELAGASEEALDDLERRAARLGAQVERGPRSGTAPSRAPYRAFRASGDRVVLVGRSAADNDALTLRVARPHDHWLHARGVTGSHVVVPLSRGETCPPELLVDAAHRAAPPRARSRWSASGSSY